MGWTSSLAPLDEVGGCYVRFAHCECIDAVVARGDRSAGRVVKKRHLAFLITAIRSMSDPWLAVRYERSALLLRSM